MWGWKERRNGRRRRPRAVSQRRNSNFATSRVPRSECFARRTCFVSHIGAARPRGGFDARATPCASLIGPSSVRAARCVRAVRSLAPIRSVRECFPTRRPSVGGGGDDPPVGPAARTPIQRVHLSFQRGIRGRDERLRTQWRAKERGAPLASARPVPLTATGRNALERVTLLLKRPDALEGKRNGAAGLSINDSRPEAIKRVNTEESTLT